jgi:F0F1-type ATP synthase membrane subunit b/b'
MDFLSNLFGSLTSGIIRLAVTVGILAAVYFFIVKPVLHTTENVSNTVNNSIQSANESFEQSFGPHSQTSRALRKANNQVKIQITHAVHQAHHVAGGSPLKLLHCVEAAHGDVHRMQRCTIRFAPH